MVDATTCLQAGECTVITNATLLGFKIIFGAFVVTLVLFLLMWLFTPAGTFLKAKLRKADLILDVNRAQGGRFLITKGKYQGVLDVPKVGAYMMSERSHIVEQKTKLRMFLSFGEFGSTLPLEYAYIVQKLRESGKKISNIEDLAGLIGLEYDEKTKSWLQKKDLSEEEIQKIVDLKVEIRPRETIKVHELAYMFPFNITPALIESKTQHMIGLKMGLFNKMNMQYVLMFIMILMGVTLAAVIAFKFINPGAAGETVKVIEKVVETPLTA